MALNELIYIAFDGNNDRSYYEKVKQFKQSDNTPFNFTDSDDLHSSLDKVDDEILKQKVLANIEKADVVLLLVGPTTKSMRKWIRWQIDGANNLGKPLIMMNENSIRSVDFERCSKVMKTILSLTISFNERILECAVQYWPEKYRSLRQSEQKGQYRLPLEVYHELDNTLDE